MLRHILLMPLVLGAMLLPARAAEDWHEAVTSGLGKPGTEMPGGVYRVTMPRTDLKVMVDDVELKPALALGSWLAFKKVGEQVMAMGDLVLLEAEVNPVMSKLFAQGIEVTALHNHVLGATPSTMYMHVLGHGDPGRLATALHLALSQSATPLSGTAPPA
jgi:Domain of Unknown Function (DUF1259)